MANPFKVLGLTPDIVRRLGDDETILETVNRYYRILSRVFHPDAGGKAKAFNEIAQAYKALSDPVAFKAAKDEYLKSRKDQISEMSAEVDELTDELTRVTSQLQEFINVTVRNGGIKLPTGLLMYDSLNVAISCEASNRIGGLGDKAKERGHFDLMVNEGVLSKTPLMFSGQDETDDLTPDYYRQDPDFVWVRRTFSGKSAISYTRSGKSIPISSIPVGTVSVDSDGTDGISLKSALAITGTREDFDRAREGYDWNAFQYLLPTLSTLVEPGRYLVGAKAAEGSIRFFLLGKIIAISRATERLE